jgi:CubicO group peptidase (beta-lactamase class C family)
LGDGGIITTAEEMAIFLRALMDGELLSDEMLDEMFDFDEDSGYGLGIYLEEYGEWEMLGHTGASSGFQSAMFYEEETETVIIVLTNSFASEIVEVLVDEAGYLVEE